MYVYILHSDVHLYYEIRLYTSYFFLEWAASVRSAPGGKNSSYATDVYVIKNIFIESSNNHIISTR